jgi:hypothetical protein
MGATRSLTLSIAGVAHPTSKSIRTPLARAELQDIKLMRISQRVSERLYNLLAIGGGRPMSELGPNKEIRGLS